MKPSRKPAPTATPTIRKPFKFFVSSTFLDNLKRRRLVQDAITMACMVWHEILYGGIGKNPKFSAFSR